MTRRAGKRKTPKGEATADERVWMKRNSNGAEIFADVWDETDRRTARSLLDKGLIVQTRDTGQCLVYEEVEGPR